MTFDSSHACEVGINRFDFLLDSVFATVLRRYCEPICIALPCRIATCLEMCHFVCNEEHDEIQIGACTTGQPRDQRLDWTGIGKDRDRNKDLI